jgi:NADPH:quinone reductase-like Zn-dependent oxidoreductase
MQAITVRDRDAGVGGLTLTDLPYPHAAVEARNLAPLAADIGDGRLKPIVGAVRPLTETADAFARHRRTPGKTIIQVARDQGERP